jgi:HK97 family phage major capsid protein
MSMFTYSQSVLPLLNAAGGTPGTEMTNGWRPALFGFPINICQSMPSADAASTSMVYFGDMSQSVFYGQRQGVSIATSTDYAFNTDSIYVRAIARNAVTVNNHDSASVAGSVTAIQTAAS